jgi:ribosomal protein S18 acetylase RimI-like enzyme
MPLKYEIIEFEEKFREGVVDLWKACGLTRPWNDPERDIDRISSHQTGKLFLLLNQGKLVGSVMTGYDGHRGSVYYLSVHPGVQKNGLGKILMEHCEDYLRSLGCPKLNLSIRTSNLPVIGFYDRLGYQQDDVAIMSRRLIVDPDS